MATTIEQLNENHAALDASPSARRRKWSVGRILAWIALALMTFLFLVPFVWMVSTSLKDARVASDGKWIPDKFVWENYVEAFSFNELWGQWWINTIIITLINVVGTVISTALVAYAFARLRWPGRNIVFSLVLATMMLPGVVTLIPQYILFAKLPAFGFQGSDNWVNTFLPLTVPAFTGSAFYIFLLRQFMRSIPMELSEAAKIDGASELRIWAQIVLPLTKPALAAIAIFSFQNAWEDFMGPLLYLQSENLYTLQLGLRQFEFAAGGSVNWAWLMAGSLVVMSPVLVVFLLFQRFFIEGVTLTGMGGR